MSHSEFEVLKKKILLGEYLLSPLRFKGVNKKNLRNYLSTIMDDFPDYVYFPSNSNPDLFIVIMPEKEDNLVLMGLSRLLYRIYKGGLVKFRYSFSDEEEEFYSSIQQMDVVTKLYYVDISDTIIYIDGYQILNVVKLYFKEHTYCYTLIKEYLNIKYKYEHSEGSAIMIDRYLLGGEISKILKHLVFKYYFDNLIKKEFVGEAYSRYISTVIIATYEEKDYFGEYIDFICQVFGMSVLVKTISPGDEPFSLGKKRVVLDNNGKVFVY